MVKSTYFITLLLISIVGYSQSFTLYDPAPNDPSYGASAVTNLYINGNDVVCYTFTGNDSVLAAFNNGSWTYIGKQSNGFSNPAGGARELEMAVNGDFWIAYFSTIDIFDGTNVTTLTTANSDLNNDFIVDLVIDNNDVKYIGYSNGFGISMVENGTWTHKGSFTGALSDLNSIFIPHYMELNKMTNDVWITTNDKFIKLNNNSLITYTSVGTSIPYYGATDVTGMTVTDDGTVWFSLASNSNDPAEGGILSFDGNTWTHYNTSNSNIPSNSIKAITSYQNQVIFNNYSIDGITIFENGNWTTYDNTNTNLALSFGAYEMKTLGSKIYIGTYAGLLEFDLGAITSVNKLKEKKYTIFPNPIRNVVNVNGPSFNDNINLEITDLQGNIVLTKQNSKTIDVSILSKGIYTLSILEDNKVVYSEKIVKQ